MVHRHGHDHDSGVFLEIRVGVFPRSLEREGGVAPQSDVVFTEKAGRLQSMIAGSEEQCRKGGEASSFPNHL
jgi:hypothetical protein